MDLQACWSLQTVVGYKLFLAYSQGKGGEEEYKWGGGEILLPPGPFNGDS